VRVGDGPDGESLPACGLTSGILSKAIVMGSAKQADQVRGVPSGCMVMGQAVAT
jgi:hypothetical protein